MRIERLNGQYARATYVQHVRTLTGAASNHDVERYRLKDERNLIGEAVYRKRAYAWISWELAGEKAGGHSLAIWMINETQLLKIRPAVRAGTSRNYQLKRLLGEGLSPQPRVIRPKCK